MHSLLISLIRNNCNFKIIYLLFIILWLTFLHFHSIFVVTNYLQINCNKLKINKIYCFNNNKNKIKKKKKYINNNKQYNFKIYKILKIKVF